MTAPVTITFLGGLGDIGRNCAAIESGDELLLLDCGQLFPDESMPGADSVLPDLSYLDDRADRIVGCITTHGHEDHIGALTWALKKASFPIYGSAFTMGMVQSRLQEAGVADRAKLVSVSDYETVKIGGFTVEFLPVTHSVPMGLISAISTPQGLILHSSDFKLDLMPIDGRHTALDRIGALSQDPGVRLLLCDSTNADVPGRTESESKIGPVLQALFADNVGRRVITASFSSHVHRVQQIMTAAVASGRRVATLGMSMKRNVTLARQLGILTIADDRMIEIEDVELYEPGEVCVVSTGSQAEARSALALASFGDSKWIQIGEHDTIALSSHPIPGNEARVAVMIDELVRRGARVRHSGHMGLHTSGHGKQEELQVLHSVVRPEWFVPVHGEYHHMVAHRELAVGMGMSPDRVLLATDGDQVQLRDDGLVLEPQVTPGGYTFVHGRLVENDHELFGDRLILGDEGMVVATAAIDFGARKLLASPVVRSRGWLGVENYRTITAAAAVALEEGIVAALADDDVATVSDLERRMRRALGQFVNVRTGRRPMILPVVINTDGI